MRKSSLTPCVVVLLLAALGACSAAPASREPDEYVGCATDENWATFDAVTDIVSDVDAPPITAPAAGATLGVDPVDFTWKVSSTIDGAAAGDVGMGCAQWNTGFSTLHLPPVSGTIYDVQIIAGGTVKHRALTTLQKWTASAAVWSELRGQTIVVKLRRMTLLTNDRKDGPFIGSGSPTFSIAP